MITIKGAIPQKVLDKYQGQAQGTKPEGLTEVPCNTPNFSHNRTPKASVLTKRLEANGGFKWELYGAPLVAKLPEGELMIYDGGHRIATYQAIFPDAVTFPALIVDVASKIEVARLFHRINGTASQTVSPNVRFISQVLGEEQGLDQYKAVMQATGIVVSEDSTRANYVLNTEPEPQWKIDSNALMFLTDKDRHTAEQSLLLYVRAWDHTLVKNKSSQLGTVTSQIVKALQHILLTYSTHWSSHKGSGAHFRNWFLQSVEQDNQVRSWLFNAEFPHDRMEQRFLGTALGITQKYSSYCRIRNKPALEVKIMRAQYEARKDSLLAA